MDGECRLAVLAKVVEAVNDDGAAKAFTAAMR